MKEYRDFACRCSPESIAEADSIMAWALAHCSWERHTATRDEIVTQVVYRLTQMGVYIDAIDCDPGGWCAVAASGGKVRHPDEFTTYVQCDQVEDGFAFTLKAWVDHLAAVDAAVPA